MRCRKRRIAYSIAVIVLCLGVSTWTLFAQQPAASQNPPDQDAQLCTIAGTVVSAATGEPLKKAHVTLTGTRASGTPKPQVVATDASGHFSVDHIPAGRYELAVDHEGYLSQQYGQDDPEKPGALLTLTTGQKMTDLIFRLQRTAVITGRVVDEDGEPMARVSVEVMKRVRANGTTRLDNVGVASTDDLGQYRIFDLSPGHYFIRATPQSNKGIFMMATSDSETPAGDDSQKVAAQPPPIEYPATYYPGTTDPARASALDVGAGDEIPRVDFSLSPQAPTRTYRIRGHVTNTIAGHTDDSVNVMAMPHDAEEAGFGRQSMGSVNHKTGNFEIANLAPGSYTLAAFIFDGQKIHTAAQQVEVTNADVDSVSLSLTRGADIAGRVSFDGKDASAYGKITVSIGPKEQAIPFAGWNEATVQADGTFTLTAVGDGTYSIHVRSKCEECYLKSASAGGVNLIDQGLAVGAGGAPSSIDLVYSANTGKVGGTVTREDDLPAAGAFVMAVPEGGFREDDETVKNTTTDQYGRFEIRGLPPGRYKALAWEKIEPESAADPDFVKPYADKADSVDVTAGATTAVQLKEIPATAGSSSN